MKVIITHGKFHHYQLDVSAGESCVMFCHAVSSDLVDILSPLFFSMLF
jgi:hypothetical protein